MNSSLASSRPEDRRSGFTLIEIMAVVISMGLLMGIVGVTVFSLVDKSRISVTRLQIKQIESALEFYRMDNSRYPTTEQGLKALIEAPADARSYPLGGYLRNREGLLLCCSTSGTTRIMEELCTRSGPTL